VAGEFQVKGDSPTAPFALTVHRGEGMVLLAMDWKTATPPPDFVGFAIEYRLPGAAKFSAIHNLKNFAGGADDPPSTKAPFQKFRWVHFPFESFTEGEFTYRVTPMFMDAHDALTAGDPQQVEVELLRETYPGKLNVCFTRGFVLSQAFVNRFGKDGPFETLVAGGTDDPLTFVATHPDAGIALPWMGFEARRAIHKVLDDAIADPQAQVSAIAYDLNEPFLVARLRALGPRLRIIIDDSVDEDGGGHRAADSPESTVAGELPNVKRQHLGGLQHNKTIVVQSPTQNVVVCGSTNFSWRGLFVQNNNAVVLRGEAAVAHFLAAFDGYWNHERTFRQTPSAVMAPLGLDGIDGSVAFSPHSAGNAMLETIAADIATATSSVLYSLAFLYQTKGKLSDAIKAVTKRADILVYGISDKPVGGIDFLDPAGNPVPVSPANLAAGLPSPFKEEPKGGGGNRMHHKFVVIDFDTPAARVWLGSHNFSPSADTSNGENLLRFDDRRIATAYAVEALRIYDHYSFRVSAQATAEGVKPLWRPPRAAGEVAWWQKFYAEPALVRDRELFA
jgi:hypothetical protein